MSQRTLCLAVLLLSGSISAQEVPVRDLAKHAAEITALTAPDSAPFHLKASISSGTDSAHQGAMEEYWISPAKWRRTIQFPGFSRTMIVNGATHYEKNEGDYFPSALRVLTEAILQPIPDKLQQGLSQSKVKLNFQRGLSHKDLSEKVEYCDSNLSKIGLPPAENSVLIVVCFSGDPTRASISTINFPGYVVKFKDRQPFGKLLVARHLISDSLPQMTWEAQVTDLSAITEPNESLFAAPENTPESQRFHLLQADEQEVREHFKNLPALEWPAVHEGKTTGVVTIYFSIDNAGSVREAWPLSSDNPEISAAACEQILGWRFHGRNASVGFMQMETFFTFPFHTELAASQSGKPVPPP